MTGRGVKADEVVGFLAGYINQHGYSPTIAEIGEGVGLASKAGVHRHLRRLRAEGRVTWVEGSTRTLRLVELSP